MSRPRPRDVGLVLGELPPGPRNAISDVAGVLVGHVTLVEGSGPLVEGRGPIRTGVTAVRPHPANVYAQPVTAAAHAINGYGKPIGLDQIRETGLLESPIAITSTLAVPRVADGVLTYLLRENPEIGVPGPTASPVVLEINDGILNDARGRHPRPEHAVAAIDRAVSDVVEGSVGAGTGAATFGWKAGIGTASRALPDLGATVGVLVCSNFGRRGDLRVAGVPVDRLLSSGEREEPGGSIVIVLATDAPLSAVDLGRLSRRCGLGLGRTGSAGMTHSGDFVVAFTTAPEPRRQPPSALNGLFRAAIEATEEAIVSSLFAAETMVGRDGNVVEALPLDRVVALLRAHGVITP